MVLKKKARYEVSFALTPCGCVLQLADFYSLLPLMSPLSLFDRNRLSPEIIGLDEGLPRYPVRRRSERTAGWTTSYIGWHVS